MTPEWIGWLAGDMPRALVSVLATEGSAPREAGTRMLVTPARQRGTIGGGALEHQAVAQARAILAEPPGTWRVQDYPLGPLLGQCCGGRVRLMVEHVDAAALGWTAAATEGAVLVTTLGAQVSRHVDRAAEPIAPGARGPRPLPGARLIERLGQRSRPLYLFGAGHVGQAIARRVAGLPFRLAWFDPRLDLATIDGLTIVAPDDLTACVADAPADAAILILTHDHALDYQLTRAALARAPTPAFVGLIGSATKRARFLSRLAAEGVDDAARARLTCPIGVAGIAGKEPDVIATAALAQLLMLGTP